MQPLVFVLHLRYAQQPEVRCRLDPGLVVVGRSRKAGLCLDHYSVSGRHCLLDVTPDCVTVEDCGSTNGTRLNGGPVRAGMSIALSVGDELQIGPFHLKLGISAQSQDLRPLPAAFVAREPGLMPEGPRAGGLDEVGASKDDPYFLQQTTGGSRVLDLTQAGKEVLIGRASDCDVHLDHPGVSRHHVRLRRRHMGWIAEDLSSVHGTFVDGTPLRDPKLIHSGQTLEIVGHRFQIIGSKLTTLLPSGVQSIQAVRLRRRVRGGALILRDVSLYAEAGELVALVGTTGAGKSTLLNALSGFDPASEGQVLLDGRDLYQHYNLLRSQIGYVPQQDILHETLPLERALTYTAQLRLPDRGSADSHLKRVGLVLRELGLSEKRQRIIRTLSGGERKRANIAAELITAPSVLFFDEPAAQLDTAVERALMGQLRDLADGGRIVVMVTHITQNIMLCDKVAFVATGGYLVFYGPPEEALAYFQVKTFSEIYDKLTSRGTPAQWAKKYLASEACSRYVRAPQAEEVQPTPRRMFRRQAGSKGTPRPRQLYVLTRRYLDLIARDYRNLMLLFLQAPLMGVLLALGFNRTAFDTQPAPEGSLFPPKGSGESAVMILFFMALVAVWFGIFSATREIVKEQPIYRRERMATIDIYPYLLSKVAVLALVGALQVGSFLAVTSLLVELPLQGLRSYLELLGILMMGNLLGTGMGLLVSAVVASPDKANTAILFLVVPQIILAGAFITVGDMDPVTKFVSLFIAGRWTFEAVGAQVGILDILEQQQGMSIMVRDGFLQTFDIDLTRHLAAMALGIVLLLVACYVALRRKDPL